MRRSAVTALTAFSAFACTHAGSSRPAGEDASTETVQRTISSQETLDLTRHTVLHGDDFKASKDQVWRALLAAGAELTLPLQSADSNAGMAVFYLAASSGRIAGRPASYWVDCGRSPGGASRADFYQITMDLKAAVEPTDATWTHLRTSMVAYARERGMSAAALPCNSNGALERRLLTAVGAKLSS